MNGAAARKLLAWGVLLVFETVCQISLKMAGQVTGAFDFSAAAFRHGRKRSGLTWPLTPSSTRRSRCRPSAS